MRAELDVPGPVISQQFRMVLACRHRHLVESLAAIWFRSSSVSRWDKARSRSLTRSQNRQRLPGGWLVTLDRLGRSRRVQSGDHGEVWFARASCG